ncbi:MAG: GNAT family N-acetyltransferase, partial [Pseudomonas sp.]
MLNRFQGWRERGWAVVDAPTYAQAWQRYGGSVATHPMVVERLAQLADIPVRYLAWEQNGEVKAAIPTWGRDLALSKDVLKRCGKKGLFDLGNAEFILPAAADAQAPLRHRGRYLSALNEGRFTGIKLQAEQLAMARTPEELSKKFRYNQRRELRLLEEAGGVVRPVAEFSSSELAAIYCDLFQRRWGFPATGAERMAEVIELLRDLLIGSVIFLNDAPIAIQLVYRVETPQWISVEYINGGVDPETREFSPGSVLSFLNTQSAWEHARA